MLPADVTLMPVAESDFAVLRELAETIWRQHYAEIISAAQIEYMLAGRFSDEALREHMQAADRWLEQGLRVSRSCRGFVPRFCPIRPKRARFVPAQSGFVTFRFWSLADAVLMVILRTNTPAIQLICCCGFRNSNRVIWREFHR